MTEEAAKLHPSIQHLLRFFAYKHLPPRLQQVSKPFCELATDIATTFTGPEASACLRKLLEAKDCAVRAALPPPSSGADES